jgi:hypothetical protein
MIPAATLGCRWLVRAWPDQSQQALEFWLVWSVGTGETPDRRRGLMVAGPKLFVHEVYERADGWIAGRLDRRKRPERSDKSRPQRAIYLFLCPVHWPNGIEGSADESGECRTREGSQKSW